MFLKSIEIQNYRGHRELAVRFAPTFNVLTGINGSGKTSVLGAISEVMHGFASYMQIPSPAPLQHPDDIYAEYVPVGDRARFEPRFPVAILATGEAYGERCEWGIRKDVRLGPARHIGAVPGKLRWERAGVASLTSANEDALPFPVFAFYRAHRQWAEPGPSALQAALERNDRVDAYHQYWDASASAAHLQIWAVSKCLERLDGSSERTLQFHDVEHDELAIVNRAISRTVEGVHGLRYDFAQKCLLVDWRGTDGRPSHSTPFTSLSDGQRVAIGLIGDIARRMCLLNPQLGGGVINATPGVILIDELDIHLHPRWQRLLVKGLRSAFPEIQFIVATHSPQILSELQPDEIIVLRQSEPSQPQVSYGLSSSQILEEIMEAESRPVQVQKQLDDLFEAVETEGHLIQAKMLLANLKQTAPGIPELAGAEALIRRKELLQR